MFKFDIPSLENLPPEKMALLVDRLDSLTPEQEALLPGIRDEWKVWGLCTDPADRPRAEEALILSYKQAALAPPKEIHWVKSPKAGHDLHCEIRGVKEWQTPFYGQHEAAWLGFYEAFIRLGLKEAYNLTGIVELGKCCNWVWMFEDFAICVERPVYVEQDSQRRLHSLNRMAIEYPDGWGLFMIHGITVDEKVVMHPEQLTVQDIDGQSNAEVRRVVMSRYGEARYIEDSGTKCIARDEFGELYIREQRDDEALCMVKVINSTPEPTGERKVYWLRVPPTMTSPKEAVAWTFSLGKNDYAPAVET